MVRAGKYKLGARAGKYKSGARAGKYKLGTRAGKYKLVARAGGRDRGPGPEPGDKQRAGGRETQRPFFIKQSDLISFFYKNKNEKKRNSIEITQTYVGRKNCNKIK